MLGGKKKKNSSLDISILYGSVVKKTKTKTKKKNLYLARAAKMMNCILYHSEILSLDFYTC